jgi:hypothetical protein
LKNIFEYLLSSLSDRFSTSGRRIIGNIM